MSYIITDNAATMKCAFLVQMPQQQSDEGENKEKNLDGEQLIEDMTSEKDAELCLSTGERLCSYL